MHPQDLVALLQARQTTLPKRLGAPGPNAAQLGAILDAAAHAPDHDRLLPWRFVVVGELARPALAEAFAQALLERDPTALPEHLARAREKAYRAPVLLVLVVDAGTTTTPTGSDLPLSGSAVSWQERVLSAGCAVQNVLLMATAQGWGSALTSGQAVHSTPLRQLLGLSPTQQVLCFVSVGTVQSRKPARLRPSATDYVATLVAGQGMVYASTNANADPLEELLHR